ncbi:hypothetical protein Bca4012_027801 [Brassica carinata]
MAHFPAGQQGSEKTIRRYPLPSSGDNARVTSDFPENNILKKLGWQNREKDRETSKQWTNDSRSSIPVLKNCRPLMYLYISSKNKNLRNSRVGQSKICYILFVNYCTQEAIRLTTFVFFVNDAKLFSDTYRRYMEKELCIDASFAGTPIRLLWRSRKRSDNSGGGGGTMRMSSRSRERRVSPATENTSSSQPVSPVAQSPQPQQNGEEDNDTGVSDTDNVEHPQVHPPVDVPPVQTMTTIARSGIVKPNRRCALFTVKTVLR